MRQIIAQVANVHGQIQTQKPQTDLTRRAEQGDVLGIVAEQHLIERLLDVAFLAAIAGAWRLRPVVARQRAVQPRSLVQQRMKLRRVGQSATIMQVVGGLLFGLLQLLMIDVAAVARSRKGKQRLGVHLPIVLEHIVQHRLIFGFQSVELGRPFGKTQI